MGYKPSLKMIFMDLPKKMSVLDYQKWIKTPRSRKARVETTLIVLEGEAKQKTIARWRSFGARHYAQYKKNPTPKRAVALRNWGFDIDIPRGRGRKHD